MRVRVNEPVTLEASFYDGGENPVDPGATTVTISGYSGELLAATPAAADGELRTKGIIPTGVDHWTVTWTGQGGRVKQEYVEVVGDFLFELIDLRDLVSDTVAHTTADLRRAREATERLFEKVCGQSFFPRHYRTVSTGVTTHPALSVRKVLRVSAGGTVLTTPPVLWQGALDWTAASPYPTATTQLTIDLEVGMDAAPQDLREAGLSYAQYLLTHRKSRIPDRALTMTTDAGTFQLATAGGEWRPTDLPAVNEVLRRYRKAKVVFA